MALEKKKSRDTVSLINTDSSSEQTEGTVIGTADNAPFSVDVTSESSAETGASMESTVNTPSMTSEPKVRIVLKVDHSCVIGGKRYDFTKGTRYDVPANVKSILRKCDLLAPL